MASRDSGDNASHRRRILATVGVSLLLVVIAFVLVVAYDIGNLRSRAIDNVGAAYADDVYGTMRDSCVKEAGNTIRQSSADADSVDMQAKIAGYCDCVVKDVRAQFTISELADIEQNPSRMASDPRMTAIVDRCANQFRS